MTSGSYNTAELLSSLH